MGTQITTLIVTLNFEDSDSPFGQRSSGYKWYTLNIQKLRNQSV